MENPNCSKHGTAKMPNGSCYYCTIEGQAQAVENKAVEVAKQEKGDEEPVTEKVVAAASSVPHWLKDATEETFAKFKEFLSKEKSNEQVPAEHSADSNPGSDGVSAPSASPDQPSPGSGDGSGNGGNDPQPLATEPGEHSNG